MCRLVILDIWRCAWVKPRSPDSRALSKRAQGVNIAPTLQGTGRCTRNEVVEGERL